MMTAPMPGPIDVAALRRDLAGISGEVRFDDLSRALYSTDASVYQIQPAGVVIPKSREDLVTVVNACRRHRCPITMRGGGTSQAGQTIGHGLIVDTSKYLNQLLEVNVDQRWARVEPGIVLDDLNAALAKHKLRFAPDISSASRATVGGMIANNSAGGRSVVYGKTIDHVLELQVLLADGTLAWCRDVSGARIGFTLGRCDRSKSACYRQVRKLAHDHAAEIERRYPKVLRRVGGYNLDEFAAGRPFNLAKMFVGSEGTLGIVVEAKVNLVPLPAAKVLLAIQFDDLLDALGATPAILRHSPSAIEAMDAFILNHTKMNAELHRLRQTFVTGEPAALLCVEFAGDRVEDLAPRMDAVEADLRAQGLRITCHRALTPAAQQAVWHVREAALGLSMSMKGDAKALSFVEDAAVAPERLRDYIRDLLDVVARHGTEAGVYAHASVGCLHVRPVVNLKTEAGVRMFESIASDVADLVLEYGGALSGEHGDGLVRSPFMARMFGDELYQAFRTIKRTFDPDGIFNPGKIVDAPPIGSNLRFGPAYQTRAGSTRHSTTAITAASPARSRCAADSAPAARRSAGTMCPSFMATREEAHSTRGRANALRLALSGKLGEAGLADDAVHEVLDLCLECRACKSECPVGVDVGRMKSEFLSAYWKRQRHAGRRLARSARSIGWRSGAAGSRRSRMRSRAAASCARLNERVLGIDRRRTLPAFERRTLAGRSGSRRVRSSRVLTGQRVSLFVDTFTNHFHPGIGLAALDVIAARRLLRVARAECLLRAAAHLAGPARRSARTRARERQSALRSARKPAQPLIFLEPSCLSAIREDAPDLLSGDDRAAGACRREPVAAVRGLARGRVRRGRAIVDVPRRARRESSSTATAIRRRWATSLRQRRCSPASPARQSSIPMPAVAAWRGRSAT